MICLRDSTDLGKRRSLATWAAVGASLGLILGVVLSLSGAAWAGSLHTSVYAYDMDTDIVHPSAGEEAAVALLSRVRSVAADASSGLWTVEAPLGSSSVSVAPTSLADEAVAALPSGRFTNAEFAPGRLNPHYADHVGEYGAIGIDAYVSRARSLLSTDIGNGIRGFTRSNGDVIRYNVGTNELAIGTSDGVIRTLFRPTDGLEYYLTRVVGS